jgi:polar amino acid transport system substrate-binding protein
MKSIVFITFSFVVLVLHTPAVFAENYTATLAQMPVYAVSKTEGVLVDFIKALESVTGSTIDYDVTVFARSMNNVITGKKDFHIPLIKNDLIPEDKLPYSFSTETIFHVNFVLYTLKGSPVNLDNLSQYKVETDRAHVDYFPFKTIPSNSPDQSLNKLHIGRIDAFVFADNATDPVLKQLGFTNIQRRLYKKFDVKIILQKNERNKKIDDMLTEAIKKLRKSGKMAEIMDKIDKPYNNWQP